MSTEYRREIQFQGPSILDDELARPVGAAAPAKGGRAVPFEGPLSPPDACPECGASGERAHAGWCEVARAERDPAMRARSEEVEAAYREKQEAERSRPRPPTVQAPRSKDPGSSKGQHTGRNGGAKSAKPAAGPDSAPLSADIPADILLTDPGAPATDEYRQALADYSSYLEAVAARNGARVELVLAERAAARGRAEVERAQGHLADAVAALGDDPLDALPAPARKPPRPPAKQTMPVRWPEIAPLLPAGAIDIAKKHGQISADGARQVLYAAEKLGLARREYLTEAELLPGGRVPIVWHRVEDAAATPS